MNGRLTGYRPGAMATLAAAHRTMAQLAAYEGAAAERHIVRRAISHANLTGRPLIEVYDEFRTRVRRSR